MKWLLLPTLSNSDHPLAYPKPFARLRARRSKPAPMKSAGRLILPLHRYREAPSLACEVTPWSARNSARAVSGVGRPLWVHDARPTQPLTRKFSIQ
jgi:hypothetical protein